MAEELDRLEVTLGTNYKSFVRELSQADDGIKDLERSMSKLEASSDDVASGFEIVSDSSRDVSRTQVELADALDDSSDKMKELSQGANQTTDEIDRMKEVTKETREEVKFMDSVLGTVTKSISALGSAATIGTVISEVGRLAHETEQLAYDFEVLYQNTDTASEKLVQYSQTAKLIAGSEETRMDITDAMGRSFGNEGGIYTGNFVSVLGNEISKISEDTGMSGSQITYALYETMDKWELEMDKAAQYLNQMYQTAAAMPGDISQNFASILTNLQNNDKLLKPVGYSFEDVLAIAISAGEDYKTLDDVVSMLNREYIGVDRKLKQLDELLESAQTEYEAAVEAGDTVAAAKQQELIAQYQSWYGRAAGDIVRETFTSENPEFIGNFFGTNRNEALDVSNILRSSDKHLETVAEYFAEDKLPKIIETPWEEIGRALNPASVMFAGQEAGKELVTDLNEELVPVLDRLSQNEEAFAKYLEFTKGLMPTSTYSTTGWVTQNLDYGNIELGTAESVNPMAAIQLAYAQYLLGDKSKAEVDEFFSKLGLAVDTLERYFSDTELQKTESTLRNQYSGSESDIVKFFRNLSGADEYAKKLETLPDSVEKLIKELEQTNRPAAEETVDKLIAAINTHDLEGYYSIVDELYRKYPMQVTVNQNFYVPAADPYTVQNATDKGVRAAQSGSFRLG